jgi:hypothetical protein
VAELSVTTSSASVRVPPESSTPPPVPETLPFSIVTPLTVTTAGDFTVSTRVPPVPLVASPLMNVAPKLPVPAMVMFAVTVSGPLPGLSVYVPGGMSIVSPESASAWLIASRSEQLPPEAHNPSPLSGSVVTVTSSVAPVAAAADAGPASATASSMHVTPHTTRYSTPTVHDLRASTALGDPT